MEIFVSENDQSLKLFCNLIGYANELGQNNTGSGHALFYDFIITNGCRYAVKFHPWLLVCLIIVACWYPHYKLNKYEIINVKFKSK